MKDNKLHTAEIMPDAGYDGVGIALALLKDGKAVRIGYLPQGYAKQLVDRGLLPASVYEGADIFWDDNPIVDAFTGSAVGGPEIVNPWKELAAMMEKGDDSVRVGLCSGREFCYWVKDSA